MNNLHDTHAHLDMLLKHAGIWPKLREDESKDKETVQIETISRAPEVSNPSYSNEHFNKIGLDYSAQAIAYLEDQLFNHSWVIQPTVSTTNFLQSQNLVQNEKIYILLGSHPEIVNSNFNLDDYLSFQNQTIKYVYTQSNLQSKLIGIGECGLDYFYSKDSQIISMQKALFESQIKLAVKLNLPLIIHCRDAFFDLFEILESYPAIHNKFLIHCFTGGIDEAKKIEQLGGKMALGGILTFNSAVKLQEAASGISLDSFFLETDLPFLAPNPNRGKTCLPKMVLLSAEKLAQLKNQTLEEILDKTKLGAELFFKI